MGRGRADRIRLLLGSVQRRRGLHARGRLQLHAGGRQRRGHGEAPGQRAQQLGTASASSVASPAVIGETERFAVGWGENARGQLGTLFRSGWEESPVPAEGEGNIAAISTGGSFTLELHGDGTVTAAGAGYYGSIGTEGAKRAGNRARVTSPSAGCTKSRRSPPAPSTASPCSRTGTSRRGATTATARSATAPAGSKKKPAKTSWRRKKSAL